MIEQPPDAAYTFSGAHGRGVDLAKHLECLRHHRFRPIEETIAGLRKGRDRAQGLVQLMGDAARHLGQGRDAGDLHQLI